jgi:hypothetical protein
LTIGLFDCPSCNKSFKVVLNKQKIWLDIPNL